jgi:potassium-transporting ATPase potassium-binding subunit
MATTSLVLLLSLVAAIFISTPILGRYLAAIYSDGPAPGDRVFNPIERFIYRIVGVDEKREQRWSGYAAALLAFSAAGVVLLYALQRLQGLLPFNPTDATGLSPALAWNTAVSFVTNTNWQNYSGESAMAHLTQMLGLSVQNFVSAGAGMALAAALIRGLVRTKSSTIGNFWVDITRSVVRVLLPIAIVLSIVFVSQGVVQNVHGFTQARPLDPATGVEVQEIPGGPIASQEAIKQLGTNGGGPYNANSQHPFENPTSITNFLQLWAMLAIPFAFPYTFGVMAGRKRQGWAVFAPMFVIWFGASLIVMNFEAGGNANLESLGTDQSISAQQGGGNLEGKDVRIGAGAAGLYAASTTGTSTGSVAGQHDSFTALGGGVALAHMMLGEVSPGGVGVGLNGLLVLALLSVFIAGLMVGRTPEFLGKRIQANEMKLVVLYILVMPIVMLTFAATSVLLDSAVARLGNPGAHGLTEMLYAFASATNNNGSAMGGLGGDTQWFNTMLGLAMLAGRFLLIVPTLALAGSLGRKQSVPTTAGTFPTDGPLFSVLVVGVTLIVAGLTFLPALALGPLVEF